MSVQFEDHEDDRKADCLTLQSVSVYCAGQHRMVSEGSITHAGRKNLSPHSYQRVTPGRRQSCTHSLSLCAGTSGLHPAPLRKEVAQLQTSDHSILLTTVRFHMFRPVKAWDNLLPKSNLLPKVTACARISRASSSELSPREGR